MLTRGVQPSMKGVGLVVPIRIVAAQPNPRGRATVSIGAATDAQLNEEWVELEAGGDRALSGNVITHLTFDGACRVTSAEVVRDFLGGAPTLREGQRLRLHSGRGSDHWDGSTLHAYLGRSWYLWNCGCGDRVTVVYEGRVVDTASFDPHPPAGVLFRVEGTDHLAALEVVPGGADR